MDIDKPLDDIIASNRKVSGAERTKPRSSTGRGGAGGGGERGGRRTEPYARPPPRSTEDTWVHDAFDGGRGGRGGRGRGGAGGRVVSGGRDIATSIAGTGVGFTGVSPRIAVENLHWEVTPADLKNIFSQAGTLVQGPDLRYDKSGRSTGTATMEYASYQQAKIAINKFDGAMTKGQTISIRLMPPATPRGAPGARGGAGGQGPTQNLLARIGKSADLSTRVGPAPGAGGAAAGGAGGPRGGRGGSVRGRGGRGGRGGGAGGRKGPANAGDLDKELDSFMTSDKTGGEDVAMA